MGAELIRWLGTTPGATNTAQTDRSQWLGNTYSSTRWDDARQPIANTQTASDRRIIEIAASIGDGDRAHIGSWFLFNTGAAAGHASRIADFRSSDGRYLLDDGCPANAVAGDIVTRFAPGGCFDNVDAAASVAGQSQYRGVALHNANVVQIDDVALYMAGFSAEEAQFRFGFTLIAGSTWFAIADEETSPQKPQGGWTDPATNFDTSVPMGRWADPAQPVPNATGTSLTSATRRGAFIERILPSTVAQRRRATAAMGFLVTTSTFAGEVGGGLVVYDVAGFDVAVVYSFARRLHVKGGSRGECLIQQGTTPVVGQPVRFQVDGPGTHSAPDDPIADYAITDDDGKAQNAFAASELDADLGRQVVGHAIISAAEPTGNPSAVRFTPTPAVTFGGSAVLTVT